MLSLTGLPAQNILILKIMLNSPFNFFALQNIYDIYFVGTKISPKLQKSFSVKQYVFRLS